MTPNVLLVVPPTENDLRTLRMVATHLAGRRIEVISVKDPSEQVDRLIKSNSCVVSLDIDMPALVGEAVGTQPGRTRDGRQ